MKCKNTYMQYTYKENGDVKETYQPCGTTDLYGDPKLCQDCEKQRSPGLTLLITPEHWDEY